jgi:uncharacterized protein (DUF433 family)
VELAIAFNRTQSFGAPRMKAKATGPWIELGPHIVADPGICGGQPAFKGTRIMVWIVLEQLDRGMSWAEIVREWDGRVPEDAIAEALAIGFGGET